MTLLSFCFKGFSQLQAGYLAYKVPRVLAVLIRGCGCGTEGKEKERRSRESCIQLRAASWNGLVVIGQNRNTNTQFCIIMKAKPS